MSKQIASNVSLSAYVQHIQTYADPAPATIQTYSDAIKALKIDKLDVSEDGLSNLWKYLSDGFDNNTLSYGYLKNGLILIRATLNLFNVKWDTDYQYKLLLAKLRKAKPVAKVAYDDAEIKKVLNIVKGYDHNAFNACLMMATTGCRIGSTLNVNFSAFQSVPEVPDVLTVQLIGKRRKYTAAISRYAFDLLKLYARGSDYVVRFSDENKTRYDNWVRLKVLNALNKENELAMLAGKSSLHSFRKWAIGKLAMSGLMPSEVSRLAGHSVSAYNPITERHYVTSNEYSKEWQKYLASLYAKTSLATWRLD